MLMLCQYLIVLEAGHHSIIILIFFKVNYAVTAPAGCQTVACGGSSSRLPLYLSSPLHQHVSLLELWISSSNSSCLKPDLW